MLKKFASCDDEAVERMAQKMQTKVSKCWTDYSLIFAMGAIFDPRMKLEMLEMAYGKVDPSTSKFKKEEFREHLVQPYKDYQAKSWTSSSGTSATPTPHELVSESPLDDDFDNIYKYSFYYSIVL